MNTAEWISLATVFTPVVVGFGVVQVRLHSSQQSFGERIGRLERSEEQQNARQGRLEEGVHKLNVEVKAGFSRLEAMLTMIVRDRQE